MVSRRRGSALVVCLAFFAAVLSSCDAFAPTVGGSPSAQVAIDPSTINRSLDVGGTRNAISAITSPVKIKHIEPVANIEEFGRMVDNASSNQVVAVWFQASWCRKCKYIGSRLRRLDEHMPEYLSNSLLLASVDVNKVAEVPQRQNIKDLPTIQFFVEGKEVGSYIATDKGEAFYGNMERHLRVAMGSSVA